MIEIVLSFIAGSLQMANIVRELSVPLFTEILDIVTTFVQCARIELQPDDGKNYDGEQHEQADL